MIVLSYFIFGLGLIQAIENRKNLSIFLRYMLAFFINLLLLFFIYLLLKKYIDISEFKFLGHIPFCNKNPERALHIGNFVFPLCYRCMCFALGVYFTILILFSFLPKRNLFLLVLSILFCLPCLIDGSIQTFTLYESTNLNRILFGLLMGFGIGYIIYFFIHFIFKLERN